MRNCGIGDRKKEKYAYQETGESALVSKLRARKEYGDVAALRWPIIRRLCKKRKRAARVYA